MKTKIKAKSKAIKDLRLEFRGQFKNRKNISKVSATTLDTKETERLNRALGIV